MDAKHKQIVWDWRGGCWSHGVNLYRWKGKTIELIDRCESYFQPVISKGKMYNCYMTPSYADWRIIYPLVRQTGHLTPPLSLVGTFKSFWLTANFRTGILA